MDILLERPFPYKLVRLWLRSVRGRATAAELQELYRLLHGSESGRRPDVIGSRPPPTKRDPPQK